MIVILQSDPGWLPERRGRLTGSRMNDACDYNKNGKESAARRQYKFELVAERMADFAANHYVSPPMQRGLNFEPEARRAYETHTGNIVAPAALVHHDSIEWFSATPDGFIDSDGLLELKVPLTTTYISWLAEGKIPEQHVLQMTAQLACTKRAYVDFCAYCPELPPPRNLFIRRFVPAGDAIPNCEASAIQFLQEVDALFDLVTTSEPA